MASLESVTLLLERIRNFEPTIAATTPNRISATDIAFALARCKKESADVIRGKYLGNIGATQNTIEYLRAWSKREFRNPPDAQDDSFFETFAEAVVFEHFSPRLCKKCNGIAEALVDNKLFKCEDCKGTGHRQRKTTDNERARLLRMSWRGYKFHWKRKYACAMSVLDELEGEATAEIRKI